MGSLSEVISCGGPSAFGGLAAESVSDPAAPSSCGFSRSRPAWSAADSLREMMLVTSFITCGSGRRTSVTRAPSEARVAIAARTPASISASIPWKKKFSGTPTRRPATGVSRSAR